MKPVRRLLALFIGLIALLLFGIGCIWFALGGMMIEFAAWFGE